MSKSIPREILRALGYTPETLSIDMGVTKNRAKKILENETSIRCSEMFSMCKVTGIEPNTLIGLFVPGVAGKEGNVA